MKSEDSEAEGMLRRYGREREQRAERLCKPSDAQFRAIMAKMRHREESPLSEGADELTPVQILFQWSHRRAIPLCMAAAIIVAAVVTLPLIIPSSVVTLSAKPAPDGTRAFGPSLPKYVEADLK